MVFEVVEAEPRIEPSHLDLEPDGEGHQHLLDLADAQNRRVDGDASFRPVSCFQFVANIWHFLRPILSCCKTLVEYHALLLDLP